MKDAVDILNQRIAKLEYENKELHATIMKLHHEYRPDVQDAERYRWSVQRVGFYMFLEAALGKKYTDKPWQKEDADAAIDEAMK